MRAAIDVPPITRRKRIPQAAIDDGVGQVVQRFHPQRIILFGSYVHGQVRPESDAGNHCYRANHL